ncbi:hypothetical protein ACH5Y9_22905 [Methylomonas sp. BW4-1]|uniref:hypothetical protein n=1 Tax=Methylomonas sp. BW4-1 TaxID=3376685 RepID=UPI00404352C1
MVQVVVVGGAVGLGVVLFVQRQGPEAAGLKQVGTATLAIGFCEQAWAVVLKPGFAQLGMLDDAPTQGVVAVLADAVCKFRRGSDGCRYRIASG